MQGFVPLESLKMSLLNPHSIWASVGAGEANSSLKLSGAWYQTDEVVLKGECEARKGIDTSTAGTWGACARLGGSQNMPLVNADSTLTLLVSI